MPLMAPHLTVLPDPGTLLFDVPFVVVDLETTGGSPTTDRVTEIGAVRVQGGEVVGELATLVDPGLPIPVAVAQLTGITDGMVTGLPPLEAVLPTLLEFARGAVLVAHNARFDTAFLGAGLARLSYPPLPHPVVCTAALARRLVREDVGNCRLATLARYFATRTEPVHRALADARCTVEVLHGLLERSGGFGVTTLQDLLEFGQARNAPLFRSRAALVDALPCEPGVYRFVAASGEVLYVGKASDLRARVRQYFGGDDRRFVERMVRQTARVEHRVCPTPLEAEVREGRVLRAAPPRYNRRGRGQRARTWVKLTTERWPRLSVVTVRRDDAGTYLGPLPDRRSAVQVVDALHDVAPLRQCAERIGPRTHRPACLLAEIGRCLSPCDGAADSDAYHQVVGSVGRALRGDLDGLAPAALVRMRRYAAGHRYERAALARDRLATLVRALSEMREAVALRTPGCLVVSRPLRGGLIEIVALRHGRLVGTDRCTRDELAAVADRLRVRAEAATDRAVDRGELRLLAAWLARAHARVEHCAGTYAEPLAGGRTLADLRRLLAHPASDTPQRRLRDKRLRRDEPAHPARAIDNPPPAVDRDGT